MINKQKARVLDVRSAIEFSKGTIPNAVNVNKDNASCISALKPVGGVYLNNDPDPSVLATAVILPLNVGFCPKLAIDSPLSPELLL